MALSCHMYHYIDRPFLFLFLVLLGRQVYSQVPAVTVTVEVGEGFEGYTKVLTCRYAWVPPCPDLPSNPDATCTLTDYVWKKGSEVIGYISSAGDVTYHGSYNGTSYVISSVDINTGCDLTIQSVAQSDSGIYICDVYTRVPTSQVDTGQAELTVTTLVPPSTITLAYNGVTYNDGSSTPVVAGDGRQFTCNTPDVYPQTTFTWTLPSGNTTDQPLGTTTSSTNTDDTVDSSNMITVSIAENPATSQLACGATNRLDGSTQPEITITVTLQIKVPPKEVQLLQNDNGLGDSLTVDQGTQYSLKCKVPSTRPAASIQWLVSSVEPSTGVADPTSTLNNGLYDTSGTWSFTADRTLHKQEVKCVAYTNETTQPYPEDTVTINVTGPPDTPLITASSPMTENVPVVLTCTADMGYPEDWRLVWSGASLSDSMSTSPSPSGQRYSFTSNLDFTPTRQDNGETVKCTARRDGWIGSEPEGSSVLDVQFCARSVSLTGCPSEVQPGSTASLRCVSESSNPASMLTWYKGDEAVSHPTDQPNVPGDYGGTVTEVTYTTAALNKSNNGDVIKCCAVNLNITCQDNVCDTCTLNIQYPPEFSRPMKYPEGPVTEGTTVTLTCGLDANPSPNDITWQNLNATDISLTAVKTHNNSTLTLANISREQAGYYRCKANNGIPNNNNDVYSSLVTVSVHYRSNIINDGDTEVGVKDGKDGHLTCIAEGNPAPTITWYTSNNTLVTSGSSKYSIMNVTTSGDNVFGYEVTGTLTIHGVDSEMDYGQYTCNAFNGVANEDILKINVTGTTRPDPPTNVRASGKTSESVTLTWTSGYDGGEDQSFIVSYFKTDSGDPETPSDPITGGENMYTITGLEGYTEYEARVYAENQIGKNPIFGKITVTTLPNSPEDYNIVIEFDSDKQAVTIEGLERVEGCIKLEVQYEGEEDWKACGDCYTKATINLDTECNATAQQSRRRRAGTRITQVRARYCIEGLCSAPTTVKALKVPVDPRGPGEPGEPGEPGTAGIIGAVVGCAVIVIIVIVLVVYIKRLPPKKNRAESTSIIPLHRPDVTNNYEGITNEGAEDLDETDLPPAEEIGTATNEPSTVQDKGADELADASVVVSMPKTDMKRYTVSNGDTYTGVQRPSQRHAASDDKNLPDVIYGKVKKNKEEGGEEKKKPKICMQTTKVKESPYEDVNFVQETDTPSNNGAAASDTQRNSGRTVNEDGLIYAELRHTNVHPADQPPIQTEESTEYATLDFNRMKMKETL